MNPDHTTSELSSERKLLQRQLSDGGSLSDEQLSERIVETLTSTKFAGLSLTSTLIEFAGHATDVWLDLLSHFRWRVRIGSMRVLARLEESQAILPLIEMLKLRPTTELRTEAEQSLAAILKATTSDPIDPDSIRWLLQYRYQPLVEAAIGYLESLGHEERIECIRAGLRNRDVESVVVVARAASRYEAFETAPVLEDLISDQNVKLREAARHALLELIRCDAAEDDAAHCHALCAMLRSRDAEVAVASVERLAGLRSDVTWPWSVESPEMHRAAMERIADGDDEPVESAENESQVAEVVRLQMPEVSRRRLNELLAAIGECVPVAQLCISELIRRGFRSGAGPNGDESGDIRFLLPCLSSEFPAVREHVSITIRQALETLRDRDEDRQYALAALLSDDEHVVRAAVEALWRIADESIEQQLESIRLQLPIEMADSIGRLIRETEVSTNRIRRSSQRPANQQHVDQLRTRMKTQHPDGSPRLP